MILKSKPFQPRITRIHTEKKPWPAWVFVSASLGERAFLDEIQRAPELLLPIKAAVDRHRLPGRFVITGSANVLTLPKVSESLAGRMEILTLWPLAQSELESE